LLSAKNKEIATLQQQIVEEMKRTGNLGVVLASMSADIEDTKEALAAGQKSTEFAPFELLDGMCSPRPFFVAGGTLLSSCASPCRPDGVSLVDRAIGKRSELDKLINSVKHEIRDEEAKPEFVIDGYVVIDSRIARTVRIGYGMYSNEIRVAALEEDVTDWTAGRWVCVRRCLPLLLPARFSTSCCFLSACKLPMDIPAGMKGSVVAFDDDGDLVVLLNGLPPERYVFKEDAKLLAFV